MSVAPQVLSTTYHYAKCIFTACIIKMGVKKNVTTDGQSVSTSWCRAHCVTCGKILILSEICCLVSVGRPL
jgi:hypothetical protein